jgi:hypothetical protein
MVGRVESASDTKLLEVSAERITLSCPPVEEEARRIEV